MRKPNFKLQLSLVIALVISLLLYILGRQIPKEGVESFIQNSGPAAPIIYILTHQLSYVLAPISGLPFLVAGFYLFGKTVIVYNYFVIILGATINFWIARKWGRPIVSKLAGADTVKKIDELSQNYGVVTLIALRMLQGGIGDFVSYGYGLTKIKFTTYILVTVLATIPGSTFLYFVVSKTNSLEQSLMVSILLAMISASIFFIGNFWIRKIKKS